MYISPFSYSFSEGVIFPCNDPEWRKIQGLPSVLAVFTCYHFKIATLFESYMPKV